MSFDRRFELPDYSDDDQNLCETCQHKNYNFECGQIGYCITKCGDYYVVSRILTDEKGYRHANIDWAYDENHNMVPALEVYKTESKKLIEGLERLGHTCSTYHHPLQKKYLLDVIIDGGVKPIELAHEFQKLEVIK